MAGCLNLSKEQSEVELLYGVSRYLHGVDVSHLYGPPSLHVVQQKFGNEPKRHRHKEMKLDVRDYIQGLHFLDL